MYPSQPAFPGDTVDVLHSVLAVLTDVAKLIAAVWAVFELLRKRRKRK